VTFANSTNSKSGTLLVCVRRLLRTPRLPVAFVPGFTTHGGDMRKALLITAICLFAPALPALAADNGFYLGGSVGQANIEVEDVTFNGEDFDADDTGYKLIAGFRPLDWLGLEASYVNFGEPEDTLLGNSVEVEGDGISAFAVGFLAAGPVDLFGKVGLLSWDSRIVGSNEDGTDLAYGVGAQFRLLSLSVRAEYEIFDVEDVDDLNMISIGVTYTFL
jgi:OOP family OmpA-OmpF porin